MLATLERRALLGFSLVAFLATLGCNPFTAMYFLSPKEPMKQPEFRLAKDKREMRVVILPTATNDSEADFAGVERKLATEFIRAMEALCVANKENVRFLPMSHVDKFKAQYPKYWKTMDRLEIAKKFEADYVIDLGIEALRLYEPGSARKMMRGYGDISVDVTEAKSSAEGPIFSKKFSVQYPTSGGPVPIDFDSNVQQFRMQFISHIARQLSWLFTAHLLSDDYGARGD
jgi:hypothetical protein